MQVIRDWVEPGSRVLDLGCGRGVLLEYLAQTRGIEAIGVDMNVLKIRSCVKRGLSAYLGDMMEFMGEFPDGHFDRVVCSRTLQELEEPSLVIREALRVSRHLTIGFVNYAFWSNRVSMLFSGQRIVNEVYPNAWSDSRPINPISVAEFERYCSERELQINEKVYLGGNWKRRVTRLANLRAGYAIYDLTR